MAVAVVLLNNIRGDLKLLLLTPRAQNPDPWWILSHDATCPVPV
jgi:hypothetical protein